MQQYHQAVLLLSLHGGCAADGQMQARQRLRRCSLCPAFPEYMHGASSMMASCTRHRRCSGLPCINVTDNQWILTQTHIFYIHTSLNAASSAVCSFYGDSAVTGTYCCLKDNFTPCSITEGMHGDDIHSIVANIGRVTMCLATATLHTTSSAHRQNDVACVFVQIAAEIWSACPAAPVAARCFQGHLRRQLCHHLRPKTHPLVEAKLRREALALDSVCYRYLQTCICYRQAVQSCIGTFLFYSSK